jgi:hypothetical protein
MIYTRRCAVFLNDPENTDIYVGPPAFLTRVNYCNTMRCNRATSNEAFVFGLKQVALVCFWIAIAFN